MATIKYLDPETKEYKSLSMGGGGVNIPAQDTEPETGNYWLDTSADGGTYYTAGEVDTLLENKADAINKATITLSTDWIGDASPYTQVVIISGITANSKVDLQPDATAIQQMIDDGTVAMYVVNDNGILTTYAIGEKPTIELTIQASITEVSA